MKSILFDIDGTLADNWHRQHLVQSDKPDWDRFFEGMQDDALNTPIALLYNLIKSSGLYCLILVSGRPERYRDFTLAWLKNNNIEFDKLYMRRDGDRRSDYIIKKEMLDCIVQDGYEVIFAVDDRSQTVKMWRENGVTCLQCAGHDF